MRVSVSQLKGVGTTPCRDRPRPLSETGILFDVLSKRKGKLISVGEIRTLSGIEDTKRVVASKKIGNLIATLNRDYDCDIRSLKYGYWCFCGRWFGATYKDYVAEEN